MCGVLTNRSEPISKPELVYAIVATGDRYERCDAHGWYGVWLLQREKAAARWMEGPME